MKRKVQIPLQGKNTEPLTVDTGSISSFSPGWPQTHVLLLSQPAQLWGSREKPPHLVLFLIPWILFKHIHPSSLDR